MAAASGLAKAWCLTVATATLGYAVAKDASHVAWLTIFSAVMFGLLDARYLREEKKFRCLYDDARYGNVELFDMYAHRYGDRKDSAYSKKTRWRSVIASWSVWLFYGPILLVAIGVLIGGRNVSPSNPGTGHESPATQHPSAARSSASPVARFGRVHPLPVEAPREYGSASPSA
jgi:hypothetical protein